MAEKHLNKKTGSELLNELETDLRLLEQNAGHKYATTMEGWLRDLRKIIKLMNAMREDTFIQATIFGGDGSNVKSTRIIMYEGCEIYKIHFLESYFSGMSIGFEALYCRPDMPGFDESERHFEEVSTEVALKKKKESELLS